MNNQNPAGQAPAKPKPVIREPGDAVDIKAVKILIYGPPGVGKTAFSFTAPNPLLIDTDGGIRRLDPSLRKHSVEVKSWDDVLGVLGLDLSRFDTLIVDTTGRALDYLAAAIMNENPALGYLGALTQKGFGVLKSRFQAFCNMAAILGKNLVFVAHDKETRTEDGIAVSRPDIIGGSLANVIREMDLVGYLSTDTNGKRLITFNSTDKHYGKNTAELPDKLETDDNSIEQIFNRFRTRETKRVEIKKMYDVLLNELRAEVDKVADAATAETVAGLISTVSHIWDSKLVARTMFAERIKALGITYDKASGKFIDPAKPTGNGTAVKPPTEAELNRPANESPEAKAAPVAGNVPAEKREPAKRKPAVKKEDKTPAPEEIPAHPVDPKAHRMDEILKRGREIDELLKDVPTQAEKEKLMEERNALVSEYDALENPAE